MESANLKGNLYSLDNGYYISKNDPLFWKKLLIQRPADKEAMYHVGLELELEALKSLDMYHKTKLHKYSALYQKQMKKSFDMVNRSFNKGFLPARQDVFRMERTLKMAERGEVPNYKKSKSGQKGLILPFVIALILGMILAILFLPFKIQNITNNHQTFILPYEILDKKPTIGFVNPQERQLWETTTVLRSATYQFLKRNGYLPKELETLTQPFPNNYLTELPNDPYKLRNTVSSSLEGEGGWLYSYSANPSDKGLESVVKEAIKPNIPYDKEIPFSPLSILINKSNHTLWVISGDQIIRKYTVALGKEDSTPEGNLFISKKVMNPDKFVPLAENVYGKRAMELSNINFAIHGTNTPASIGQEVSQGCIRLNNSEIEDLYAITPLYTPVKIEKNPTSPQGLPPTYSSNNHLYNSNDNSKEEDNRHVYHWAN